MSTQQVTTNSKPLPVEVNGWNGLIQHTEVICQGTDKKLKICLIDEEQEEIRVQNQEEFDLNVKYAQDHGIKSLILAVYIDDKRVFDGIYHIEKPIEKMSFPNDKLQILFDNVLADKWYIPVKQDEALGVCLQAAINIAQEGKLDTNPECKRFIESIIPEAFRKLQNTQSVFSWPREIQCGIFEMTELLIDLVGIRLRYPPVPVSLLNTLAMTFDTKTTFSQKHKNEFLPSRRTYTLKEEDFLRDKFEDETFGWLRSILQRFIAQNGLKNVRLQFEYINLSSPTTAAIEYNTLLKLFSKCYQLINHHRYQLIFIRPIRQAIQYLQTQKSSNEMTNELQQLHDTLVDICCKYDLNDEINKLRPKSRSPNVFQLSSLVDDHTETTPLIETPISAPRKSKNFDCYEQLAEDIRSMTMNNGDAERKNIKKQRTDEQPIAPLFTRNNIIECIDELLTATDKRSLKRKHRREQRLTLTSNNTGHINKKEMKRSNTITLTSPKSYDRSNPEDILRYFAPMKTKIANLYDNLQNATSEGNIREVLKIEEKLKLLRPFSARFIADENTPDGTRMKPGETFRKGWILLNDGSLPWDSNDIQLINLSDGIEVVKQPIVPITAPHERAVITVDYKCSEQAGTYESKWILSYRQQTFGPMIWCSIEISHTPSIEKTIELMTNSFNEFEFIEVPLPACFDLSKPFQRDMKLSDSGSLHSSFTLSRSDSVDSPSTCFNTIDNLQSSFHSDIENLSTIQTDEQSSSPPPSTTENRSVTPPIIPNNNNNEEHPSTRLNQPLDFVDSVVTNIFSVAKQAGSTAKAIFHTLQAFEEHHTPVTSTVQEQQPILVNSFDESQTSTNGFFEHIGESSTKPKSISSDDPMKTLIEMGFANRGKNQRLLKENANDLAKVIELLTLENNDECDWFARRH